MGSREAGDNQVMVNPGGRGDTPRSARGEGEEDQVDNRSGRKAGRARHEGRGAPKGVGPQEEGSPGILGQGRAWGHLELGNRVMWGLGVT